VLLGFTFLIVSGSAPNPRSWPGRCSLAFTARSHLAEQPTHTVTLRLTGSEFVLTEATWGSGGGGVSDGKEEGACDHVASADADAAITFSPGTCHRSTSAHSWTVPDVENETVWVKGPPASDSSRNATSWSLGVASRQVVPGATL
jgi:hypothetical protein